MSELEPIRPEAPSDVVHFSDLKKMHLSPAHFQASVAEEFEATRAMRVGTICHHIILGPSNVRPLVRYRDGDRKGGRWTAFAEENDHAEIVTDKEWDEGEAIARALLDAPYNKDARRYLDEGARFEVPLAWESSGIKCRTRGIDIIGPRFVADLKVTSCTEPRAWMRHALKLLYPQQMAFYEEGCEQNAIDMSEGMFLIGVESKPPYVATVLRMTAETLLHGHKSCVKWIERLRACRENAHWPGYTQKTLDFVLPDYLTADDDE